MSADPYRLTPDERILVNKNVQRELANMDWVERNHAMVILGIYLVICLALVCLYLVDIMPLNIMLIIGGTLLPFFVWYAASQKTETSLLMNEIEALRRTPAYRERNKF